jgi:DDB1- and CUL4-associated factor 1
MRLSPDRKRLISSAGNWDGTKLWDVTDPMAINDPLFVFPGVYAAQFSSRGDRIVATYDDKAAVIDSERGNAIITLAEHAVSGETNQTNVATFSPCDSFVLNDGVLWDLRVPQVIHRFDKFTNYGSGSKFPRHYNRLC